MAKLKGNVAIFGRNEQRFNEVSEKIKKNGSPKPLVIVVDVTKEAQRIIDEIIKHFNRLDVLV